MGPHGADLRRADAGAAEALASAYGDRVYRLALRITGNAADAEEVVQDALWAASRKIHTFRGAAAFGSWVYRIAANAAYEKLRGRQSQRNEVSWEDLAPAFDEKGQHVEVTGDWSRRLKDPAIETELKSVLSERSRRRRRSGWGRSSRGCTGRGSSCGGAWQTM